jgi:CPA1 family monovalent cation:H+ antiporter
VPVHYLPGYFKLPRGAGLVLTWGGLRGGISVALALSLPSGSERDVILSLTYCIVVVSILVQGLTVGKLAEKVTGPEAGVADGSEATVASDAKAS